MLPFLEIHQLVLILVLALFFFGQSTRSELRRTSSLLVDRQTVVVWRMRIFLELKTGDPSLWVRDHQGFYAGRKSVTRCREI